MMEANWFECDEWDGVRQTMRTMENPTWPDIEAAIRALDQERHTLIRLLRADAAYMAIGGGRGSYIVYVEGAGGRIVTLNTERYIYHVEPPVRIVVGGQEGEYPARYVVSLDEVIEPALGFAEVGGLHSRRSWTGR